MIQNILKARKIVWLVVIVVAVFFVFTVGPRFVAAYYFGQGKTAFDRGNFEAAKMHFARSLTFNSKRSETHFYLGKISLGPAKPGETVLYPEADYQEAVSRYEQALSLGIRKKDALLYAHALNDTGFSYWMLGEYDKADAKFLDYIAIAPNSAYVARLFLALDYYNRLNKPKEALGVLLPALDGTILDYQRKSLYTVYLLLANLSWYFGDVEDAKKYAELSLSNAPATPDANEARVIMHMRLALALASKGELSDALKEYGLAMTTARMTEAYSGEQSGKCSLAKIYFHAGDHRKAIMIAESELGAQRKDYYFSRCLEVLTRSYLAIKDEGKSKKYIQQYIEFTDTLEQKDILMLRARDEFIKLLQQS